DSAGLRLTSRRRGAQGGPLSPLSSGHSAMGDVVDFQIVRAAYRLVLNQGDIMVGKRRPSRRRELEGLTITELANLAGTTARALRYYEELDLLKPHRGERQERFYSSASVGKALQVVRMR